MSTQGDSKKMKSMDLLIVADKPQDLLALENMLHESGLNPIKATSGEEALQLALEYDFALILIAARMPGLDGSGTAALIRSNLGARHIPVILVAEIDTEPKQIYKGYESGAVDYLFKPIDPRILKSKVGIFIDLHKRKAALQNKIEELNAVNRKILEQQAELVEEERLKLLLQLAGASAHELNQPLMTLLGNIELLRIDSNDPEKQAVRVSAIEEAGHRIADIVKRIQNLGYDQVKSHPGGETIAKTDRKLTILWVEDDDVAFDVLSRMLDKRIPADVTRAAGLEEAKSRLTDKYYDLSILDLKLPDGDSFELLDFMKVHNIEMPVVVLTGYGDERIASRCIQDGAHEYLPKGSIQITDLSRAIDNALERFRLQQEIRQSIRKMAEMSTRDVLTGLYNRRYMIEIMEQEAVRAGRLGSNLACLLFDLDHFKQVNDTYGHACGDFVLQEFAKRLRNTIGKSNFVFRYGGEEFMALLPQTDREGARWTAENIRDRCQSEKFVFQEQHLSITTSIGIAVLNDCRPCTPRDLIAFADKALYRAKADGRNCTREYRKETGEELIPAEQVYGGKGLRYLKEQLSAMLEKTKKAAMNSMALLIRDTGGKEIEDQNRIIAQYLTLICDKLHLPAPVSGSIIQAAALHGCFKILLGEELMNKKESLTPREKALIRNHPHMLVELTGLFDFLSNEKSVLLSHHEKYDGTGYPDGLQAGEIPLGARIFSIADAMAAMTSERPYREKIRPEKILAEFVNHAGTQFDPMLVGLFLDIIAEHSLLDVSAEALAGSKEKLRQTRIAKELQ